MNIISTLLIFSTSIISGFYTSLWGAYKDSPYEGFKTTTFLRSIFFSIIIFFFLYFIPNYKDKFITLNLFQVFLLIMGIERVFSEIFKGFFRDEDQEKYFIPSRITFIGKHITSDTLRFCLGVILIVGVLALLSLEIRITSFEVFLTACFCAGLACAVGGAYKDAPFEGFKLLLFFRSPFVLVFVSPIFFHFDSTPLGFLIFMSWGIERFIVEYYKTYIQRTKSGKFKRDIQRIQEFAESRQKYHYLAQFIILGFFLLLFFKIGLSL